jgi:hypothetical protein
MSANLFIIVKCVLTFPQAYILCSFYVKERPSVGEIAMTIEAVAENCRIFLQKAKAEVVRYCYKYFGAAALCPCERGRNIRNDARTQIKHGASTTLCSCPNKCVRFFAAKVERRGRKNKEYGLSLSLYRNGSEKRRQ